MRCYSFTTGMSASPPNRFLHLLRLEPVTHRLHDRVDVVEAWVRCRGQRLRNRHYWPNPQNFRWGRLRSPRDVLGNP